jgi:hypothetical protein
LLSTLPTAAAESRSVSPLLSALVHQGGNEAHFSARTMRINLSRGSFEGKKLNAEVGASNVAQFDQVFTYVVDDAIHTVRHDGYHLPAVPRSLYASKALAFALFKAGVKHGTFDIETLFDTLFSASVHDHAMGAVAQKYGPDSMTVYHTVFSRLVQDLGSPKSP